MSKSNGSAADFNRWWASLAPHLSSDVAPRVLVMSDCEDLEGDERRQPEPDEWTPEALAIVVEDAGQADRLAVCERTYDNESEIPPSLQKMARIVMAVDAVWQCRGSSVFPYREISENAESVYAFTLAFAASYLSDTDAVTVNLRGDEQWELGPRTAFWRHYQVVCEPDDDDLTVSIVVTGWVSGGAERSVVARIALVASVNGENPYANTARDVAWTHRGFHVIHCRYKHLANHPSMILKDIDAYLSPIEQRLAMLERGISLDLGEADA